MNVPRRLGLPLALLTALAPGPAPESPAPRWGYRGHEIATRAAVSILPGEMPDFFRNAEEDLVWLAPEPDRWRNRERRAMDQAWAYDHYIDLENVPSGALEAPDRFTFLRALYGAGVDRPEQDVGFLPYRIVELHQRLTLSWKRWHEEDDPDRRRRIERRIVSDAGLLGHYVTDGSQPHHTTIHFNGWAAGAPNPEGFTEARDFHSRFERFYVDAHVVREDLLDRLPARLARDAAADGTGTLDTRAAVLAYLETTFATVPALYRIERDVGFDPDGPRNPVAHAFAADRLAAGAEMLARLWLSAWSDGSR